MKTTGIVLTAVLIATGGFAAQDASAQQTGLTRTNLQQHDLSIPGREVVQVRVEFAPGAVALPHRHPGEEIVYVLEGSIEYQIAGASPKIYKAGEALTVPYGVVHSAKNVGNGNAVELATYIVEKGKPLVELVK